MKDNVLVDENNEAVDTAKLRLWFQSSHMI